MLGRRALWEVGLNYGHGTGHGVGNYFGVHECMVRLIFLFLFLHCFAELKKISFKLASAIYSLCAILDWSYTIRQRIPKILEEIQNKSTNEKISENLT